MLPIKSLDPTLPRREFLRLGLFGASMGLFGPQVRALAQRSAVDRGVNRLIIISCYGGFDGLSLLAPVTNQAYHDRRPTIRIDPSTGLALNGTVDYQLHPSLPGLRSFYDSGEVAIVRKVGYPRANLSHFTSEDIYSFGVRGPFADLGLRRSGWIARFAEHYGPDPLDVVGLGVGKRRDFQGTAATPLVAKSLSDFQFAVDSRFRRNHELRMSTVRARLEESGADDDVAEALRQGHGFADRIQSAVADYEAASGVAWPTTSIGRRLKDVSTLMRARFPTRIFFTGIGGFDTHSQQGGISGRLADLFQTLDDALIALRADLQAQGTWSNTVIVLQSEFGRRNFENSSGGTDHGHGNTAVVLGGGVVGGLYGPDITEVEIAEDRYLAYSVDFRDIYREIVSRHLHSDPRPVFPEPQETRNSLGFLR